MMWLKSQPEKEMRRECWKEGGVGGESKGREKGKEEGRGGEREAVCSPPVRGASNFPSWTQLNNTSVKGGSKLSRWEPQRLPLRLASGHQVGTAEATLSLSLVEEE